MLNIHSFLVKAPTQGYHGEEGGEGAVWAILRKKVRPPQCCNAELDGTHYHPKKGSKATLLEKRGRSSILNQWIITRNSIAVSSALLEQIRGGGGWMVGMGWDGMGGFVMWDLPMHDFEYLWL